jgi:tetratricopeptide (TPR) repeat protein
MDSKQVLARFEAERQALALMDHPNIARVLDGGTTASGRPYFVMDLVKGMPITKYCDEHRLMPRQRLELFIPLCQAIQHAHQKGIIHRDLKPSNVLVALYDGKPVPKVIDFGVAKAAGQSLTDKTLVTGFGNILGTLEYMSPEQAELNNLDIDTRSDVYSLGALLYELLTGSPPFRHKDHEGGGLLEMLRVIREQEPTRPSDKLSTADGLPTLAANRGTPPAQLTKLVRGELDWVVMKALEKDRNRRYETANGFAADVQRYLAGEAVHAVPPSAGYRFRKFARKNRRALVTASVIGVALLMAVGSLGWVLRDREAGRVRTAGEVNQFLQRAESLYADNKLPEAAAEVEKARSVLEAGRGDEELERRARQWLTDLDTAAKLEEIWLEAHEFEYDDRWYADFARAFRECGIDVELLPEKEAAARVAARRIKLDLVMALTSWARLMRSDPRQQDPARWQRLLAIARAADPDPWHLRRQAAVEARDVRTLRDMANEADLGRLRTHVLVSLGYSLRIAGDAEAAVAFLRKAQRRHPGDFTINSYLALCLSELKPPRWDEAIAFRRVALSARPQSVSAHGALGTALKNMGRLDEAVAEHREAVRLKPDSTAAHNDLGSALADRGLFDEALACFRKAIELDPKVAMIHYNIGDTLLMQKKPAEAMAYLRKAIELDPKHVTAHTDLGTCLARQNKLDEALVCYRKAIELDPKFAKAHNNLGDSLRKKGLLDEAIACFREAVRLKPDYKEAYTALGSALLRHYRQGGSKNVRLLDASIAAYREVVRLRKDDPIAHNSLGAVISSASGREGEAIACFQKAIELDPKYAIAHDNLGICLARQQKLEEAVACLRKAIELDPKWAKAHLNLIDILLEKLHRRDQAADACLEAIKAADFKGADDRGRFSLILNNTAWQLATHPDPKARRPAVAAELAKEAVRLLPGAHWNTLGVAHYRAGEYAAAVEALERSMKVRKGGDSFDWFFLAMAHWHLGDKGAARRWYDRAVAWMNEKQPRNWELIRFRSEASRLLGVAVKGGV